MVILCVKKDISRARNIPLSSMGFYKLSFIKIKLMNCPASSRLITFALCSHAIDIHLVTRFCNTHVILQQVRERRSAKSW